MKIKIFHLGIASWCLVLTIWQDRSCSDSNDAPHRKHDSTRAALVSGSGFSLTFLVTGLRSWTFLLTCVGSCSFSVKCPLWDSEIFLNSIRDSEKMRLLIFYLIFFISFTFPNLSLAYICFVRFSSFVKASPQCLHLKSDAPFTIDRKSLEL